jgi:hypothetical protein
VSLLWLYYGEVGCFAAVVDGCYLCVNGKAYIVRCNIQFYGICPDIDLLYRCSTQIHEVKKSLEIVIVTAVWSAFTIYLLWYLVAVKRREPISMDEAKMLWKIHKKNFHCASNKWQPLTRRGGKIEGFQCDCGYKYAQNRPIMAGIPKSQELPQRAWGS